MTERDKNTGDITEKSSLKKPGRLLPLLILVSVLALAIFLFFYVDAQHSITGVPTYDIFGGWVVLNVFFWCWLGFLWPATAKQRRVIGGLVLFAQVAVVGLVQMQGVYGNGRPVYSWRWQGQPADHFQKQLASTDGSENRVAEGLPTIGEWPQFRGPNRDGIVVATANNSRDWSSNPPRELWRKPVGSGWSSFSVAGNYCFTMEQRGDQECVSCYELKNGEQVWCFAREERFSEITGGEGPRSTPTFDNGFIYAQGATGVLSCLDAKDGSLIWDVDVLVQHDGLNCRYGMCASPLIVGSKLIVNPGAPGASLVAYNKRDGSVIWQGGDAESSYSSPQLVKLCGVDQVLNFNAEGLYSHHLETGKVLWSVPWISEPAERNNVCQPIQVANNRVFISSGYGMGSALFELTKTGPSNKQPEFNVATIWKTPRLQSKFSSAIFDGKNYYGLDQGIMVCLDATTGDRKWKNGRYLHGQMIKCGDFLVVQSEKGYVAQVKATPIAFTETARLPAMKRRSWNHPVIVGNYLLVRNDREMVCYKFGE